MTKFSILLWSILAQWLINRFTDTDKVEIFSQEEEQEIIDLSQRDDLYEILAKSLGIADFAELLAPSIYEHEDVKKGILLQLFGGAYKDFGDSPRTRLIITLIVRGDVNILLVGDPSTSKSQLLHYAHKVAPRGVYTSGKGSSAVGLTAYVTRDPETRHLVLERFHYELIV